MYTHASTVFMNSRSESRDVDVPVHGQPRHATPVDPSGEPWALVVTEEAQHAALDHTLGVGGFAVVADQDIVAGVGDGAREPFVAVAGAAGDDAVVFRIGAHLDLLSGWVQLVEHEFIPVHPGIGLAVRGLDFGDKVDGVMALARVGGKLDLGVGCDQFVHRGGEFVCCEEIAGPLVRAI
ncbi:hypothetical protein N7468_005785 [Penicillium chermesinum]|uniref:Uncharacterized protein n=1 Tax=Penicillium chermesinum TaxID=63820 RepID=A0A9W9NZZ1_9EURO|nr:uncharacterized protein N7468_005785 [Penicillium chermesinum]KAJ5232829.1 hypothetical protein N7468_005785 [Penicillium chermesinum]